MSWMFLAEYGESHVIAQLARHKHKDLNQTNERGVTPAAIAAYFGQATVIAELAKYPDINLQQTIQSNARMLKQFNSHGPMVMKRLKTFLQTNNTAGKKKIFMRPEDIAIIMGHEEVITLLQKSAPSTQYSEHMLPNKAARAAHVQRKRKTIDQQTSNIRPHQKSPLGMYDNSTDDSDKKRLKP
jgi:hypothetical protein